MDQRNVTYMRKCNNHLSPYLVFVSWANQSQLSMSLHVGQLCHFVLRLILQIVLDHHYVSHND